MEGIPQYVRFTPVGEYLRLVILQRLARGPAPIEEVDELAKRTVEKTGMKYDWKVWPKLLAREVELKDGTVAITQHGRWILEQTGEEVARYVQKWLGVSL
jgi:hypothetical protein